jgi:hypothetical protein
MVVVPADELALVGIRLLLDGVVDDQDGWLLPFFLIEAAHQRLEQAPQGG